MNIQEISDEYLDDSRFIGPEYPGATHFIGPDYPGDLGMSRRFMLDRPLKGLRNVKKVLENSVTEFFVLELSRVRSPGIFCSGRKKSWNFLKKNISRIPGKNWIPGIFWSQNFPILERSVWKFSVPGFCFPENSGIRNCQNTSQFSGKFTVLC